MKKRKKLARSTFCILITLLLLLFVVPVSAATYLTVQVHVQFPGNTMTTYAVNMDGKSQQLNSNGDTTFTIKDTWVNSKYSFILLGPGPVTMGEIKLKLNSDKPNAVIAVVGDPSTGYLVDADYSAKTTGLIMNTLVNPGGQWEYRTLDYIVTTSANVVEPQAQPMLEEPMPEEEWHGEEPPPEVWVEEMHPQEPIEDPDMHFEEPTVEEFPEQELYPEYRDNMRQSNPNHVWVYAGLGAAGAGIVAMIFALIKKRP